MRKPAKAALAALFLGLTVLPGCYIGPWWWYPEHDGYREHHDRRRGALTPPREEPRQGTYDARRGHDGDRGPDRIG